MIFGLELERLPLDTLEMRRDIKQSIFFRLTKKLLQKINIHLESRLDLLIILVFMVDFVKFDDDVHEELLAELTGAVLYGLVQVDKELYNQLDDVIVYLVVFDD
jgi:hypothetical protein